MTQMLHYNEICAALRGLVQSGVALTENAGGSDLVSVGSNRLFSPGRGVALTDDEGHREEHTVSEVVGPLSAVTSRAGGSTRGAKTWLSGTFPGMTATAVINSLSASVAKCSL